MNQQAAAQRSDERIRLEQQLAGSVVYYSGTHKPYLAGDVLAVCNPGMFISPKAKAIMEGVQALTGRSEQVDIVTVGMEIQRRKKDGENLPIAGDEFAQYVNAATCISERSVMEAAHIIAGEWRKDMASVELGKAMQDMQAFAVPVDVPLAGIREAQAILDAAGGDKPVSLDARLDEYAANLAANDSRMRPVRSPWDNLNRILRGGILPKELAILAARPGVGKSALALNWAWSVACSGETAIFFSLEMGREQLLDRLVANRGGIDLGAFREGLTQEQRARVQSVIRDMRNKSLDIIDDTRITVGEVRRRVRIAQRLKKKVGLVVVDYLQLCTPEDTRAPREQQVAAMSRGFKLLAKELGVPVLLLAQLNRRSENSGGSPALSDLRESGAIEQDADIVIFLHQARKDWHSDEPVQVIVAKGRSSGVGREYLVFRRRLQRFEESTAPEFKEAEAEEAAAQHWTEREQGALI